MARLSQASAAPVLMLCPHVRLQVDGTRLVADASGATFTFECSESDLLHDALLAFGGGASLRSAARRGLSATLLQPAVDALTKHEVLVDLRPLLFAATIEHWLDAYFSICDRWARDIFACDFWFRVLDGTAPIDLVLGWAREFYHRTVGADEHNELSVCHCRDPFIKTALATHFREERGHGEIFLRGLVQCGVPRASVEGSAPLPTTRALIEYMNKLAVEDSLAYLGCYGILHSPRHGQTRERVRSQFDRLADLYPPAAPIIKAIEEHAVLDLALGHEQIELERYVRARGVPSREDSTRIMRAAHGMARVFAAFFAGIWSRYGCEATERGAEPPRRRST